MSTEWFKKAEAQKNAATEKLVRDLTTDASVFMPAGLEIKIERIPTFDEDIARTARKVIRAEIAKRIASGAEFDVGFACGLSFALGAFSGACEDEPTKKGADHNERIDTETCAGCRWRGRHQKCSCCRRNRSMRDAWEEAAVDGNV